MKWYFAARTRHTEAIKNISIFLEEKGETIASDWIYLDSLKPFEEKLPKVQEINRHIIDALLQTDVFVLISDAEGTDMFVELGVALAKEAQTHAIRIYIVGEHAKRSLLQLHPAIVHTATLAEVFNNEHITHDGFEFPTF